MPKRNAFWLVAGLSACGGGGVDVQQTEIVQSSGVFDPCASDLDCPAPTSCETVTVDYATYAATGAFCTLLCARDVDCPPDGACVEAFGRGGPLCAQACASDADCVAGFGCIGELPQVRFTPVCLPM